MNLTESLKDIFDISQYIGTPAFCGLRTNPIKQVDSLPFELKPCPFFKDGYYINESEKTGNHPLHFAGAYYLQEPSAMSALSALQVQKDDVVLDMCAAPGSKATAIAAMCKMLVANEYTHARVGALIGNIERMGISNALVLNSDSAAVGDAFLGYFDKVLVDSPCSGEGMFRKHPEIVTDWTPELVTMCAERSKEVLSNAAKALKQGGRLVYSTCTYNLEENEKVIIDFLESHPDFEIADTGLDFGQKGLLGLSQTRRITVSDGGEGHFVCALKRVGAPDIRYLKPFKLNFKFNALEGIVKAPPEFLQGGDYGILEFGDALYAVLKDMPNPKGVRIMRAGVKLGAMNFKTFKPDHHLFMALKNDSFLNSFEVSEQDALRFYRGEALPCPADIKGYTAITHKGLCIGFAKASGGQLKNHLPKGLRI